MQETGINPKEQYENWQAPVEQEKSPDPKEAEKARRILIDNYILEAKNFIAQELIGKDLSTSERVLTEKDGQPAWDKIGVWVKSTHGEQGRIAPLSDLLKSREGELALQNFINEKEIADQSIIDEVVKRLKTSSI